MFQQGNGTIRHDRAALKVALAVASTRARSLRRRLKTQAADADDFRQAILLELVGRAARFDPCRGTWGAFVSVVTRHAAARLANHRLRHPSAAMVLSLDPDIADANHRVDAIDLGLDLRDSFDRLPRRLKRVVDLIVETGSVANAQRASGLSTASFYRALAELRLCFIADGLVPDHGSGRVGSNRSNPA